MNKIYLSGNYVIVEKDGNVYEYPRTLSVYTLEGSNYVIKERIDDGQFVIPISQIGTYFDEAGAVAYTEATLVTFLRENTGFKTAGGGSPADADAQLFIDAASITDSTQQSAINQLVIDLKNYGIWTKMKAIYPFVGGTASSHKFNLKDPRDLDVAFRLVFNGGWTHSANGALPNGTNAYAETYMIPSTNFNTIDLATWGYYSRTDSAIASEYVMGSNSDVNQGACLLIIRRNNNIRYAHFDFPSGTSFRVALDSMSTDGRGFFIGSQEGPNIKLYRNGTVAVSNSIATANGNLGNLSITLGAFKALVSPSAVIAGYTNKEAAFSFISTKLTDTEAANFYTAVQAFQTTLSRQV